MILLGKYFSLRVFLLAKTVLFYFGLFKLFVGGIYNVYQNHIFLFTDHNNIMVSHLIIFTQNKGMFNVSISCFFC